MSKTSIVAEKGTQNVVISRIFNAPTYDRCFFHYLAFSSKVLQIGQTVPSQV